MKKLILALLIASPLAVSGAARAADGIEVHLKGHKFYPSTIKVKANQPSVIILYNDDDTADEFDSPALKVEKVVGGHSKGTIRLRALPPGKSPFRGEFHAATAQGVVIAQ